jgi:basic membrane protein A and related proteins
MKRFKGLLSVLLVTSALSLVGCGKTAEKDALQGTPVPVDNGTVQIDTPEPVVSPLKISMVTDIGGINDKSFNEGAYNGMLKAADDFGVGVSYRESKQDSDYIPNLEQLAEEGNDIIFGIGYKIADSMAEIAENYPEQQFAIIDYAYDPEIPNVTGVLFKDNEASYLVGYIAGKMSETNTVGFIGGMEGVVISRFEYGFKAGVKAANPDVVVLSQYADSYADQATGKLIATTMYQSGADILFHAAGDTGTGVIEAAKEQNKKVIGVDMDQSPLAPDNVITSTMKQTGNALYDITSKMIRDEYVPGGTIVLGLSNGGVGIAPTSTNLVPADILSEVTGDITNKIISQEIVVPENKEQFEAQNN